MWFGVFLVEYHQTLTAFCLYYRRLYIKEDSGIQAAQTQNVSQ